MCHFVTAAQYKSPMRSNSYTGPDAIVPAQTTCTQGTCMTIDSACDVCTQEHYILDVYECMCSVYDVEQKCLTSVSVYAWNFMYM